MLEIQAQKQNLYGSSLDCMEIIICISESMVLKCIRTLYKKWCKFTKLVFVKLQNSVGLLSYNTSKNYF